MDNQSQFFYSSIFKISISPKNYHFSSLDWAFKLICEKSGVSDDTNPVTLEATGTYQLIVGGNGLITGDFSFRVGVAIDDRVRKSPYEKTTTPTNPEGD